MHRDLFTDIVRRVRSADQYATETERGISGLHHPADYYIHASDAHPGKVDCGSRFGLIPAVHIRPSEVQAYVDTYIIPYKGSSLRELLDFADDVTSYLAGGNGLLVKFVGVVSDAYVRREIDERVAFPGEPALTGLVLSIPVDADSLYGSLTKAVHIDFNNYTVKSDHGRLLDTFPDGIMLDKFWQRASYYTSLTLS